MYQSVYVDKKASVVHLWDDEKGHMKMKYRPYAYKLKPGGHYRSIYGQELERVEKFFPGEQGILEGDVPPETRVLIDGYGDSDEVSKGHRIAIIDIETSIEGGYPRFQSPSNKITAIAIWDNVTNKYRCFILDEENIVANAEDGDKIILAFRDEEEMLMAFVEFWESISPTIVTGWNVNEPEMRKAGFDFPYMVARLDFIFGEEVSARLSPIGICRFNQYKNKVVIAGVNILDYLLLYRRYSQKQLTNYRLDTVAQEELQKGKTHYVGSLDHLMKTDIKKYIEYNLNDIILVKELDDHLKFIDLAVSICHVCHVPYEEYHVSSKFLEGALLTYLHRKKLVAPNKTSFKKNDEDDDAVSDIKDDDDDDVGFDGAYVKDPIPGRYEWVCSADINSLYPSVIMSLNISPETKLGVIENWSTEKFVQKSDEKITLHDEEISYADLLKVCEENNWSISSNGVVYDQKKVGCIPDILKKWFSERVEYKNKLKDAVKAGDKEAEIHWERRQKVQKILLNSLYGVLGLSVFRFYDLDNALAVTATGQDIIKTSARYVNKQWNKRIGTTDKDYVIYIDTDSLYIDMKSLWQAEDPNGDVKTFCIKNIDAISDDLNVFYRTMMLRMFHCTDNRIRILADVVAKSAMWLVKKRYAMLKVYDMDKRKDVDKIDVKGLDTVRSSYPKKFRSFMKEILSDILNGATKKEIDKKVVDFKGHMREFKIEEIAKNTSVAFISKGEDKIDYDPPTREPFKFVKGTTAQAKAALAYNDMLIKHNVIEIEPIMSGGKIKWAYLKDNPLELVGLGFKDDGRDPKQVMDYLAKYIDRNRLWDSELHNKLVTFYTALSWEIYNESGETIDEFFSF